MEEIFGMELPGESTNSLAFSQRQSNRIDTSKLRQDKFNSQLSDETTDTVKRSSGSHQKIGKVQVRVVPTDTINSYTSIPTTATFTSYVTRTPSFEQQQRLWQSLPIIRNVLLLILIIISGGTIFTSATSKLLSSSHMTSHISIPRPVTKNETIVTNEANRWDGDTEVTTPATTFSVASSDNVNVSSLFSHYYSHYNGVQNLGKAVTVAFPTSQGWIQFFQSGALLLPDSQRTRLPATQQLFATLISSGVVDTNTGIIRLPLLQSLLTVGSEARVGDNGSSLTFADLRNATSPALMILMPTQPNASSSINNNQGIFIEGGTRAGHTIGHIVLPSFWNYITRPDISPDGWKTDFGPPLTEALPFTINENGVVHQMRVQLFARDGVILDQSNPSQVQRIETGDAYLNTLGTPDVVVQPQQSVWTQTDAALFAAANSGQVVAHVAQNYPLILLGDTAWHGGTLWYHIQWSIPQHKTNGWITAQSLSFTSPGKVIVSASIDLLSPQLASYLTDIGANVGVTVFDVTRQRYYTYNDNSQFAMASSMKVPIMLTFLDMTEQQGREPNDQEMQLLTTMIENSNNDSASALFDEEGKASAVTSYMQKIHIPDMSPNDSSWGYSLITPLSMVKLLTMLYEGKVLTDQDRQLALSLMQHIESDQQVGVGDTAPNGATVAMKDGWVTGPDGMWVMNSSGIVSTSKETYIISVYTQDQSTLQDGQAISEHVCQTIASLLT